MSERRRCATRLNCNVLIVALAAILPISFIEFSPSVWAARDPKAAKVAVDAASQAMSAKRYDEAAAQMELAYGFDPNPLWLANAGYARMMAAEPDKAVDLLSRAIADVKLQGEGRVRAVERLGKASAAKAFVESSVKAAASRDFKVAARAMDEAFAVVEIGTYALEAGGLWENAREYAEAEKRFSTALSLQDLKPEQQAKATEGLARVARLAAISSGRKDPVPEGTPRQPGDGVGTLEPADSSPKRPRAMDTQGGGRSQILPWVLVGSGVAVAGGGVTLWFLGEDRASELREAHASSNDGPVTGVTRVKAQSLAADAETFRTVGVIGTIAGVALTTTGVVLLAMESGPEEDKSVIQIGADLRPTRWMLTAGWRW